VFSLIINGKFHELFIKFCSEFSQENLKPTSSRTPISTAHVSSNVVIAPDKRFVFSAKNDIELLKEVLTIRPYDDSQKDVGRAWDSIGKNLGGKFSGDTARKRFALLLKQHSKADSTKNRR
jgi:hypothetical protein